MASFLASLGPFMFGISLGWSAPAGPIILKSDNSFPMTANAFSWAVSMMPLGAAFSCVLSGLIRNRFGTKIAIFSFSLPNLLGWLALIFALNSSMVC